MSNGHSGTVFCVLCKKISTGREKLAPIDWHDWHVFATLDDSDYVDSNAVMDDLCLHAEPNELGLVEGLRDLPCQDSVHRADHHQEDWVAGGNHTNIYLYTLPYCTSYEYFHQ